MAIIRSFSSGGSVPLLLAVGLCAHAKAVPQERAMWMMEPVAFDSEVPPSMLTTLGEALRSELSGLLQRPVLYGYEALRPRVAVIRDLPPDVERARDLLRSGESQYMAFDFARAAASLGEAAGQFSARIGDLSREDLNRCYEARVLEALAWMEAGHTTAAIAAFAKLLRVRTDYVPDPALMPPRAHPLLQEARRQLQVAGVGAIEVVTDPVGAEVWVDGVEQSPAPVTVLGVPVGTHQIRVSSPAYTSVTQGVSVRPGLTRHRVRLEPGAVLQAARRLGASARGGQSLQESEADLVSLASAANLAGVVLVGVGSSSEGWVLSAMRWDGHRRAAVVAVMPKSASEGLPREAAERLATETWPAAQILPPGAEPLDADFDRGLLGMGPTWGRQSRVVAGSVWQSWWFWTGAVVIAGSAAATAYAMSQGADGPVEQEPDHVRFGWEARQ